MGREDEVHGCWGGVEIVRWMRLDKMGCLGVTRDYG
jgi:hypothetical protein